MTKPKRWPNAVENLRLDAIALLLDNERDHILLEQAELRKDPLEVLRLNKEMFERLRRIRRLLNEARRRTDE